MRKESIFTGAATAIVTPMNAEGIDYEAFARILNWQVEQGIDALVICGTTGEGSTLSDAEHREVLQFAIKVVGGRVPMIAGTGSNDAAYAIELTKYACSIGYDAMLLVTPYYNKTTQRGLVAFFTAIADASTKPVILYNVPSRTGVNIEPATYVELAKGTTALAEEAFRRCSALKTVWLPDTLTAIGRRAFEGCSALEEVYMPQGVTLGDGAFNSTPLADQYK